MFLFRVLFCTCGQGIPGLVISDHTSDLHIKRCRESKDALWHLRKSSFLNKKYFLNSRRRRFLTRVGLSVRVLEHDDGALGETRSNQTRANQTLPLLCAYQLHLRNKHQKCFRSSPKAVAFHKTASKTLQRYRWVQANPNKQRQVKFFHIKWISKLSGHINTWEIGVGFLSDFELSGNSDFPGIPIIHVWITLDPLYVQRRNLENFGGILDDKGQRTCWFHFVLTCFYVPACLQKYSFVLSVWTQPHHDPTLFSLQCSQACRLMLSFLALGKANYAASSSFAKACEHLT